MCESQRKSSLAPVHTYTEGESGAERGGGRQRLGAVVYGRYQYPIFSLPKKPDTDI